MAFVRTLDAESSKEIHEALKDPLAQEIRFIDTGEHSWDFTMAEVTRSDGTEYTLTRRHKRFRDAYEIVNELDLPWEYHDTFIVALVMPKMFAVTSEVQVTATQHVEAYTEQQARETVDLGTTDAQFDWATSDWRVTSVTSLAPHCSWCAATGGEEVGSEGSQRSPSRVTACI